MFALLILDDNTLRVQAPRLCRPVRTTPLTADTRAALKHLTAEEIWAMLNHLTPIEETRAYQSIFARGQAEGVARGRA